MSLKKESKYVWEGLVYLDEIEACIKAGTFQVQQITYGEPPTVEPTIEPIPEEKL
ncbi:MAG: hypothetical protein L0Y56_10120 [Nitrospira sp.]|nr:hypothetical protein [Nitrospira sp.]